MNALKLLLLIVSAMSTAITYAQDMYEPGVAKSLAEYRKATISDLHYDVQFQLPADCPVSGSVCASFILKEPTELVFDFKNDSSSVHSVHINGASTHFRIEREHIILPAISTKEGRNNVEIVFTAGNQSFNRRPDLAYTLFVPDRARTAFPCFDQPDLKARFTLTLDVPKEWKAVSNAPQLPAISPVFTNKEAGERLLPLTDGLHRIAYTESEPLPTYLFAFATGEFQYSTHIIDGRKIGVYYRESNEKRVSQIPEIARQVAFSLKWLEDFTGVSYPFAKYDLVILPGFQFGGMEHTGATFYNDNTIFLNENPTPDEVLARTSLIAHETAHMWFGDYVTMRWFDDVWTKEVFANYFAAEITAPLFPDINHVLNRLKTYASAAYSEDRVWHTPLLLADGTMVRGGGTSIRQPLENLCNAGLVYNNIIYNKAPLMMYKMVEIMGREAFRKSIREYVSKYAYANASWDELVEIFDKNSPADIKAFSYTWVNEKGMPTIHINMDNDGNLCIKQSDPYGRGLRWPQSFDVTLHKEDTDTTLHVTFDEKLDEIKFAVGREWGSATILPNTDGQGYGIFTLNNNALMQLIGNWRVLTSGTARQATLMNLYENYLSRNIEAKNLINTVIEALTEETEALTASTLCSYLLDPLARVGNQNDSSNIYNKEELESRLCSLAESHALPSVRTQLIRVLMSAGRSYETSQWLYDIWNKGDNPLLSTHDYMTLSYELAVRMPLLADSILQVQRERLVHPADGSAFNADRVREFDFVSRAARHGDAVLDEVFAELLTPDGRRIEPWAASAMALLNHPLREYDASNTHSSVRFIRPALEALSDVQRTGDIFFPANWSRALLNRNLSPKAREEVEAYLNNHPLELPLLRNKILNAATPLFR